MNHHNLVKAPAKRNKKIATALLAILMILSVSMILTVSTQPSYAASGSVSYNPSVLSYGKSTLVVANGGTFASDASVSFYISSTTSFSSSSTKVGTYALTSGATTLSDAAVVFTIPSETPGTYYLAASDDGGSTFTSAYPVTLSPLSPSLTVNSPAPAGGTTVISGSGFDPGSAINVYLGYAGGQTVVTNIIAYTGYFSTTIAIPQSLSQSNNPTYVVAQEASTSSTNYGITAYASFTLQASISVSPNSVAPALSSTVTVTGFGFSSGSVISSNSVTLTPLSGSITGVTNPATTVSALGEFSLSVTFDSIGALGPVSIGITTSPSSSPSSFSSAFYISQQNDTKLGFIFAVTATTGSTYNVGDAVTATVYNFPTSQTVQVYLGSTSVGTITTNRNGFGQLTTTVPAIPAGTYYPTAAVASGGVYAQGNSLTISSYFSVANPSNVMLTTSTSEYIPSNAMLTVSAFGLNPTQSYDADDSLIAPSGVFAGGLVTSISVGTAGESSIYPASNGTLIFTYSPNYSTTSSSSSTITMSPSVAAYSSYTFGYRTIGVPSISSPATFKIIAQTSIQTLTVGGLIPFESAVYPGTSYYYGAYIASTPLTLTFSTSVISTKFYASGGAFTGTFTTPSLVGALDLNVTYYGSSFANGIGSQNVVISALGSSYSSGSLQVIPLSSGYEVVGYGYYLTNPSLYYMKYAGLVSVGTQSLTNGAFAVQIVPGNEPAGTYTVFTELSNSGTTYFVYSSYSAVANISITGSPTVSVDSQISPTISGLQASTYYKVYFGNVYVTSFQTTSTGVPSTSVTVTVPTLPAGSYYLNVTPYSSNQVVLSQKFKVEENSHITLATGSQYAFPGQLVQFTVSGFTAHTVPSGTTAVTGTQSYTVTVQLNGTNYETVSALLSSSGALTGSFLMPNSNPGSYYLATFTANETQLVSYSIGTTPPTTAYATVTEPFTGTQSDFLGLTSGNGAYILGISQSQIAQIETAISGTLSVPLSELNASVASIKNNVAEITTVFGTMTASLGSINATVNSINSGVATVQTTLGQVKTSLGSLNSTLIALNGDTAVISTAIGVFNTTLNNINATVTISGGNVATIKTDLGIFTGNVTSVSNGIATIQTKLGTIQSNTSQVAVPYGISFIIEVLILVLVVIAVAFSFIAMRNAGRPLRKL